MLKVFLPVPIVHVCVLITALPAFPLSSPPLQTVPAVVRRSNRVSLCWLWRDSGTSVVLNAEHAAAPSLESTSASRWLDPSYLKSVIGVLGQISNVSSSNPHQKPLHRNCLLYPDF